MTQPRTILVVILLAGLGYGAWVFFFPNEKKQIQKTLVKLAETASFSANEKSLSRLGAINAVPRFFHTNAVVRIDSGRYRDSLTGRNDIREAVAGSRAVAQSLDIKLTDPQVTLLGSITAKVLVTATVYVDGDPNPQLQILKLEMEKEKNRWLIKKLDPINLDDVKKKEGSTIASLPYKLQTESPVGSGFRGFGFRLFLFPFQIPRTTMAFSNLS